MINNYATNIALIERATNTVSNIIWGNIYQEEEFTTDEQLAIVIEDLAVVIGDTYDGKNFYHGEEKVLTSTEVTKKMQEELEFVKTEFANAQSALNILIGE